MEVSTDLVDASTEVSGNTIAVPTHGAAAFALLWEMGVVADLNGLELRDGFRTPTYEEWETIGRSLFLMLDSMQFHVGDWVNWGERLHGEQAAQAIDSPADRREAMVRLTDRDPQTITNWTSVAGKVAKSRRRMKPDEQGRRLSYQHHVVVAPLAPDAQTYWLGQAIEEGMSARELKNAIHDHDSDGDPEVVDEPEGPEGRDDRVGDGLTQGQMIERAARLVWHQASRTPDGAVVPPEAWAQLGAALGEEE